MVDVSPERSAVIDEYAEVRQRMLAWRENMNPHAERYQELQAKILSWCESEKAELKIILKGGKWSLPISARQNRRMVKNVARFIEAIGGLKTYAELMPPTLGLVEQYIPADKRAEYITEERTGRRMIQEPVPSVTVGTVPANRQTRKPAKAARAAKPEAA